MKDVFELPPKHSFKNRVNLESRYGTCLLAFLLDKAIMQCPRQCKD
jgi:hypothetical protein